MKLWYGRFQSNVNEAADSFNSSLSFDKRLYACDIAGSKAHCTMLGECNIISDEDAKLIVKTLDEILNDINNGKCEIKDAEDIHSFVENELVSRIGAIGKKLHTGRSRNDQVALDIRLYLRDAADDIVALLKQFASTLTDIAENNLNTVMPAFTHLQKAQPTTLAHHMAAYAEMLLRDISRFEETKTRINVMPLGSGACTSTPYPINRQRVAELLNFPVITANSMDAVSDRDFVLDFLYSASVAMMHLSRLSEEIIIWSSDDYKYIELSDGYSTGSSIMPQKKNPDMNELIRGKTGRVYGDLMSLLTVMKGIPLAYDKDMQEDKEMYFDALNTTKGCLQLLSDMLKTTTFNKARMKASATGGFTNATDAADYLVNKGVPFRDAHGIIGQLVLYAIEQNKALDELTLEEYQKISDKFDQDIYEAIDVYTCVNKRNTIGACGQDAMKQVISLNEQYLNNV